MREPVFASAHRSCRASRPGTRAPRRRRRRGRRSLADAARQDEGERAALDLLVLGDQVHQAVGVGHAAGHLGDIGSAGRPPQDGAIARSASACGSRPRRAENSNASAMPIATASPCSSRSEKPAAASSAWPKVWPRLSSARSPVSRSSRATIAALARQLVRDRRARARDRRRTRRASWPRARRRRRRRRSGRISRPRHSRRGTRAPAACRAARCRRPPGSAGGRRRPGSCRGGELIAVLPPTEESTCASSVVGTCTIVDAAPHDRRGEAGEIADHAAAERDHEVAALDPRGEQRVADAARRCAKLFDALARRHRTMRDAMPAPAQRCLGARAR